MGLILLILLILLLLGAFPKWPHAKNWGPTPMVLILVLIILLILAGPPIW